MTVYEDIIRLCNELIESSKKQIEQYDKMIEDYDNLKAEAIINRQECKEDIACFQNELRLAKQQMEGK